MIVSNFWREFVSFPEAVDQMLTGILEMEEKWQFPSAFGEVDGCHIPMKCPKLVCLFTNSKLFQMLSEESTI